MFIAALPVVAKINVDDKESLKNLYNRIFCSRFKNWIIAVTEGRLWGIVE